MKQMIRITQTRTTTFEPDPVNYDERNRNAIEAMLQQDIADLQRDEDDDAYIDFDDLPDEYVDISYKYELVNVDGPNKIVVVAEYDDEGNVMPTKSHTAPVVHDVDDEEALSSYKETE